MSGVINELTPEERAQLRGMREDDAALPPIDEPAQQPPPAREEPPRQPPPPQEEPPPPQQPQPTEPELVRIDPRALEEERRSRRELQKELAEERRKSAAEQARIEERLRLLTEAAQQHLEQQQRQQAPPAEEMPAPDFSTDPAGFIQHGFRTLHQAIAQQNERINRVETGTGNLTAHQQQQAAQLDLINWGARQEQEFAREHPDYGEAIAHLRQARERLVRLMGTENQQEIERDVADQVQNLALLARQRGMQFGQVLYEIAQEHGYRPRQGQQPQYPAGSNGQPQRDPGDTAAERLVRGRDMATTIGASGAAPRGEPGPQHIANMSDKEFNDYYAKVRKQGPAALKQLLGA